MFILYPAMFYTEQKKENFSLFFRLFEENLLQIDKHTHTKKIEYSKDKRFI